MAYTPTGWAEPLLKKHMLFSSIDVDEARAEVSQVLNDHQLQPSGASVAARLHGAQVDSLTVCMLEYGQEVSVETQPAEDFILVQMALTGQVSVECTEGQWVVRPGQGLIMPSKTPLRLRWQEGARQLILKIPLSRLYAAYHGLTGEHPRDPVTFNRELPLDTEDGAYWSAIVRYFCTHVAQRSVSGQIKAKAAGENLISHLLTAQSTSLQADLSDRRFSVMPGHVRRAQEYMEAYLHEDLSLKRLAEVAKVSTRSLSRGFQDQYGVSPMQKLRELRLDRIRQTLEQASEEASVSDVAMRWGYTHLGRFAAAYRQRFGEAPHQTLKSSRLIIMRRVADRFLCGYMAGIGALLQKAKTFLLRPDWCKAVST